MDAHSPSTAPAPAPLLEEVDEAARALSAATPEEALRWTYTRFARADVALASSLAVEDQLLTHLLVALVGQPRIFTLDTGRLFPELYELLARTEQRYGIRIDVAFPEGPAVEALVRAHGVQLFHESVELRQACCRVRKVEPLERQLRGLQAWITGQRREQAPTRTDLEVVEWDAAHGLVKVNPLCHASATSVWDFVRTHDVPYAALQDRGFASLGCAPCTRAIAAHEELRAGRWWWEDPAGKECGLHVEGGRLVRAAGPQEG